MIPKVEEQGLAIPNLPSLPHINIVGSMITGTHGSGIQHPIQADMVTEFDLVLADGSLRTFSRETTPDFERYLLNFGSIGVITSMKMQLVPKFNVHKAIYTDLTWESLESNLEEITQK